jgi:3-hydroxyacyl-[acyl-carrier-protein] dehydratase
MSQEAGAAEAVVDINEIQRLIPHRPPFLMIDRVLDLVPGERAVGIKNVTINEPFFEGHFPSRPVMPGVLIIEAMAQTATLICAKSLGVGEDHGLLVYFMGIDKARFRRPVTPGDRLELHVERLRARGKVWRFEGVARVDGAVAAEADFMAMIMGPEDIEAKG